MRFILSALIITSACALSRKAPTPELIKEITPVVGQGWSACKSKVANRGVAPDWFLDEVLAWGKKSDAKFFEKTSNYEVYSHVVSKLGPYTSDKNRRAVMLEVIRTMSGMESSWRHTVGLDSTNASSAQSKCREEAGILQTSQNAIYFGDDLKQMQKDQCSSYGKDICTNFILCSKDTRSNKANRDFVYSFTALLWRKTVNHHGPLKRREVFPFLSKKCVAEFEARL